MSFKREGDDSALLNSLQHRRVCEILGNNIPDTEASLLSNGRLTCLICSYRPVFDNIPQLSIHRQGKKHIHELSKYLQRKSELELRAVKETQKTHVYAGLTTKEPAAHMRRTTPCKSRRFCHDRKLTVEAAMPATPTANVLISSPEEAPSASSLVRKYLKSVERGRPLQKTIEQSREGYGGGNSHQQQECTSTETEKPALPVCSSEGPQENPAHKSGWRLSKETGDWEKDPDAEFDSDEQETS